MPATLQEVKRKIQSTKKTGQITGAMQMISTVKLSQIQGQTKSYQVYASKIQSVITHLAESHFLAAISDRQNQERKAREENEEQGLSNEKQNKEETSLTMLEQREVKHVGIVVVTSDRGLVGGYNSNVLKQTMDLIEKLDLEDDQLEIIAIGRTGLEFFRKRGYRVIYEYTGVSDVPTFREIRPLVAEIVNMYNEEVFDELHVCYNHFVNMLTSEFRSERMLPITEENLGVDTKAEDKHEDDNQQQSDEETFYETEPSEEEILEIVLPQYAESLVYGAILDAKTAEHASSANAMRSATDNANDIISTLQLQYNRARQAAITTEITEITGAQAAIE